MSSPFWPEGQSGQCVVGGIYGSGAVKRGYRLSNIFVETACSCAVGLQISKTAYNRHTTPLGCVGSLLDVEIKGMFFDEEFYQTGGYDNFLSGETKPNLDCIGNLSGKIENLTLSGQVAGRAMIRSDFVVDTSTVLGLKFEEAVDPHPIPEYVLHASRNAYAGSGGTNIDQDGVAVQSSSQCTYRCHTDWSCDCVVFQPSNSVCWKMRNCDPANFDTDDNFDVYTRPWSSGVTNDAPPTPLYSTA